MTSTDDAPSARGVAGWVDAQGAADYLGFNAGWIRQLCRDGKLHHVRGGPGPGAPFRFRAWWLDAFMEGRTAAEVAAEEKRQQQAAGLWTGTSHRRPRKRTASADRLTATS